MWSDRVNELNKRRPGLITVTNDPNRIFENLKTAFLVEDNWEDIASVFSPIVLHLVSEIVRDVVSDPSQDDLGIVVLFSNLINTFPSIQPLIMFFIQHRPIADSSHIAEPIFLRSVFRLLSTIGPSFEIRLSQLLELLEADEPQGTRLSIESGFYLSNIVGIMRNMSETELNQVYLNKYPLEAQIELYTLESKFSNYKIPISNFGEMKYETPYAITVNGVPFLRSMDAEENNQEHPILQTPYARSLALAMLTNKPVMVIGPAGSGKSTIIQHLARLAGTEITSLHLGSAVDAKSLLGGYICGEIPGEFRWLDGPLTAAIRENRRWIVLEQIEMASAEVLAVIQPLLSEQKLFIPGRSETLKMGYNTRIFATCFKPIESSLWTKLKIDYLSKSDTCNAILCSNPELKDDNNVILKRNIDMIYDAWAKCKLTYHELFRVFRRLTPQDLKSDTIYDNKANEMFQIIFDTFTSHIADQDKRLEVAQLIESVWDIQGLAESYLRLNKPPLITSPFQIGSVTLPFLGDPTPSPSFAYTFTALHNMESVARALSMREPVLLVGETGTGKTTLVQFIASSVGAKFTVINMHHQSDTLDIIGGFKPVDLDKLMSPFFSRFMKVFSKTFDAAKNAQSLNLIDQCKQTKQWKKFLNLILKFCGAALSKESVKNNEKRSSKWTKIRDEANGYLSKSKFLEHDFAFAFVEGPLATAFRTGQWILLDEVNLAPPETLLALAPLMDGTLTLPNGEILQAHPNFRLICCMNPATDVGKTNLPETLIHKFVTIYSDETSSESDIKLILDTRGVNTRYHHIIYDFYTKAREMSNYCLTDGSGRRIMYTLRALTRSILYMNKAEKYFGSPRACYDALYLSFVSPLSPDSAERLIGELQKRIDIKSDNFNATKVVDPDFIEVEGFLIKKGPLPIKERPDFILTDTARQHLRSLAQAAFLGSSPILLQGPTSSGKTSIVEYLADITGHEFVRINNHEHTDISEYIGAYATTESGAFEFVEGALVRAVRSGAWVVLDELNLAPSDVLEALNRLLDQNNELYIAETQTVVRPADGFQLFATQNPPGIYGGRKQLSRAFRGRFIELHVDEIAPKELNTILIERCHMAPSFAKAMVDTFLELRQIRQFTQVFAGKQSFLTVRDLLRWANRNPNTWEEVADEGFALLGERLRTPEERNIMKDVITKNCKGAAVMHDIQVPDVKLDFDIVWTSGMRRSVDLLMRCIRNKEPALLVGETGTGKTTAVQVIAAALGRRLRILNCHQHTEASDFLGAMRPARIQKTEEKHKLFEWKDGSLVDAMRSGDVYLLDEISLAQDSALERLNSVLEPSRSLAIAEKPEYEIIKAHENFAFIATMNPGGDYGKRELSPALRNRFTEIWVPSIDSDSDLLEILAANSSNPETKSHREMFLKFVRYYTGLSKSLMNISLRDILQWIRFVDSRCNNGSSFADAYVHGAFMVFIDCVYNTYRNDFIKFLSDQLNENKLVCSEELGTFSHEVKIEGDVMNVGAFQLQMHHSQEENKVNFVFSAPTTSQNLLRVARALQMHLPVLIEGPPGVGKTSLVASLGQALGFNVVRINLSEHTEMLDLVGSELPVENGVSGQFEWRDGAFLTALKNGDWVILDELNLASQSVLEGLNSCLDHRASLFVPELGEEFKCHPNFRIFGCQNPAAGGGGRKCLPRSFLNRFTRVYVEELTEEDFDYIISNSYEELKNQTTLRSKMISFIRQLNELKLEFEFNLRDVFRWCQMMFAARIQPVKALQQLFIQRLRTKKHRQMVLDIAYKEFGDFSTLPTPLLISPSNVRVGDIVIERNGSCAPQNIVIHPAMIRPLETIFMCAKMNWPGLIVGQTATSKSSLVRVAAHIIGRKLIEFSMNSSVDTTELLGGFEQVDNHRCFEQLKDKIRYKSPFNSETLAHFETINDPSKLHDFIFAMNLEEFKEEALQLIMRNNDKGTFEWVDGLLLQAMRNGWWIIIDNANLCPPAVLDRLNPLCEPGGFISLNERGLVNGNIEEIHPHENFRLFMTVDPKFGDISRAMRNRAIEIYLPSYYERLNDDKLLEDECKALAGENGLEFMQMMKDECTDNDLRTLSAWNMISFKTFKEQASVAQLGDDAAHFNIAHCSLTEQPLNEDEKSMTRSNSSFSNFISNSEVLSVYQFKPVTNTMMETIIYDSAYLSQVDCENNAAIKFFAGSTKSEDIDARLYFAQINNWRKVEEVLNVLRNYKIAKFEEDLPLDKTLWPNPQETLKFNALYLLMNLWPDATASLQNEFNDVSSIQMRNDLITNIQYIYNEYKSIVEEQISDAEDNITPYYLLPLRVIDFHNKVSENSIPLMRFLIHLFKKGNIRPPHFDILSDVLIPKSAKTAKKARKEIGEPFTFKTKQAYSLWEEINKYWQNLYQQSDSGFYKQSNNIIQLLSQLIQSQVQCDSLQTILQNLQKCSLPKEVVLTFMDEIEEMNEKRMQPTTVQLSTPFPSEHLQEISLHSVVLYVIDCLLSGNQIKLPKTYSVMLDLVAIIDSYNKTKSFTDLVFALYELIFHMENNVLSGPGLPAVSTVLGTHPNLLEAAHNKELTTSLYNLLKKIPALQEQDVINRFTSLCNKEAEKLCISKVDAKNFDQTFLEYAINKWNLISPLSEVDDSYYHMVVAELTTNLQQSLQSEMDVTNEIMKSRIGNDHSVTSQAYEVEMKELKDINFKSLQKSKYRGQTDEFPKVKSIIERIGGVVKVGASKDIAKSIDESATSILRQFPLYRDITVPIVTSLREVSSGLQLTHPNDMINLPFPFTAKDLLNKLFESTDSLNTAFTFSIIGHTQEVVHKDIEMHFPELAPDYSTISEEEKREKQIEELFSKEKKDVLNVLTKNFVDSMLRPTELQTGKLLNMFYKQVKQLQPQEMSMESDLLYLPLVLFRMSDKKTKNERNINIYQKSSASDLEELAKVVYKVVELVTEVWKRYPGHEQLRIIIKSANALLNMPTDLPLIEFLNSLEILMNEIRNWQHKERDFGPVLAPLVTLANKWLQMRLESWKMLFENRRRILQQNVGRSFYTILEQFKRTDDENIGDFFALVCDFIDTSSVGVLKTNLDLLEAFAIYSQRYENSDYIFRILINLVVKFRSYLPFIEKYIATELIPLEKKMKEYMSLQKWDTDSDKKHMLKIDTVKRQLNKYCQEHMEIIKPIFRLMIDQLTDTMIRTPGVPYSKGTEIDEITDKLFNNEEKIRIRIYNARIYANQQLDIQADNNQDRLDNSSPLHLFMNETLFGTQFNEVNELFGTSLSLLTKVRKLSPECHLDIRPEESEYYKGFCENLVIMLIKERKELHVKPQFYVDGPLFVFNQVVTILKSFSGLDNNSFVSEKVAQLESYGKLTPLPIIDVVKVLGQIKEKLENNYVHLSILQFIDRSIPLLQSYDGFKQPQQQFADKEILVTHLGHCRFVVAIMKQILIAMLDGYGESDENNKDDEPQQEEGQDGVGLGEGVGEQDITNEIEDEDQLLGDNVNTNNDKQDEDEVDREGGFEVEPDMPEDAPDVSAHEEEEQMDDEMGETKDGENVNERNATDDKNMADKEADLEKETTKENTMQDQETPEEDPNEISDKSEDEDKNNSSGEISISEQEDEFESDAAQWDEEPEKIEIPSDDDRMLEGNPEGEEEETNEKIVEERPPDIEEEPDLFEGKTAQDKANAEEEDNNEQEDIEGGGKGESKGAGDDGEGGEDKANEEEEETKDEEKIQEKEMEDIEKQLEIVQKKILEGEVKEGDEGGQRDEDGTEGVILPAEEAKEIPDRPEEEDKQETEENKAAAPGDQEGEFIEPTGEINEEDNGERTSMNFKVVEGETSKVSTEKITAIDRTITEESRAKWISEINDTHDSAAELCEQLRLVLEATVAAKMKGDFRTGKRLNMRKIIPFIASEFRRDKIWMRRVQPDQRNYQVMLAIDNSASMAGVSGQLAIKSVCLITQALTLLGIGDLCVTRFGEDARIVHKLGTQWSEESGAALINAFTFDEQSTAIDVLLEKSIQYFEGENKGNAMQLCFIISDGVFSNKDKVRELIIQAQLRKLLIVFVIIDSQTKERNSILLMKEFVNINNKMTVKSYLDTFPFPFYVLIKDPASLPERLSDALRQWFDLANASQ
ncbi:hypothetical protein TVAG_243360 [Trichomonas vaginalis G3]|uniref:Midasin n=1 Tax=Trichomonas vaginalis (strain ATCC PRA-98 / G3) TaxID=412133 RepID=A2FI19_TRIV3|nr:midasin-related family [Trichomonas vaginalis G3]EAX95447.1 hypothetical protein TVAG_243360 [Trichomonas vaginalis G3]KAI5542876.1 midasin-related family [Trichomonas vaginalis G3]|eukprot:XP_001308377.1 hypothetical protein [Trichomonas vaginalis G3]